MNKPRILFWHRKDLRIFDNQALIKAFSLSNAITSTNILKSFLCQKSILGLFIIYLKIV